jgi:membrane fusion protein, multidrug efflux system
LRVLSPPHRLVPVILLSLAAGFLAACQSKTKAAAPGGFPTPLVSIVETRLETVPIYSEFAAQTFARDTVEIRGRVDGYIEKRLFQIGSEVQAGQPLYILDLRPYQADVQKARGDLEQAEANNEFAKNQVALVQAQADLAQAQANLGKAQQDVDRLTPLVKDDAAAQQDLDNAISALSANQASVRARQAAVEQARLSTKSQIDTTQGQVESSKAQLRTADLNLGYATISSPISGRIGDSLIQVGGLVTKNSSSPLTTVVPLNPIWVRFKVSEAEYLDYVKRTNTNEPTHQVLELTLANNSVFPFKGRIENSVNQVDQKTGTLELQATFPNPKHVLLPGQFGRVRLETTVRKDVILVPQRSIQELQGQQSVLAVDQDNKVLARIVITGERVGERWVVLQGLKPGDRVIVEGLQKVRPGMQVKVATYKPPPSSPQQMTENGR